MWSSELFAQLARHAKSGTTVATFIAASQARKDLIDAGFDMTKRPGFSYKRKILIAVYRGKSTKPSLPLWYQYLVITATKSVTVIDGGLAGCATAALAQHGISVNLFEAESQ